MKLSKNKYNVSSLIGSLLIEARSTKEAIYNYIQTIHHLIKSPSLVVNIQLEGDVNTEQTEIFFPKTYCQTSSFNVGSTLFEYSTVNDVYKVNNIDTIASMFFSMLKKALSSSYDKYSVWEAFNFCSFINEKPSLPTTIKFRVDQYIFRYIDENYFVNGVECSKQEWFIMINDAITKTGIPISLLANMYGAEPSPLIFPLTKEQQSSLEFLQRANVLAENGDFAKITK